MGNKNHIKIIKTILVMVVFILGLFILSLFVIPDEKIDLNYEKTEGNNYIISLAEDLTNPDSLRFEILKIISTPFDLTYYNIYVEDTSKVENKTEIELNLTFVLGDIEFTLTNNSKYKSEPIKLNEKTFFEDKGTKILINDVTKCHVFEVGHIVYAKLHEKDLWCIRSLFIIFSLGILTILFGLFDFIYVKIKK